MNSTNTATPPDPPVYSVPAFCEAHGISRGYLYELWARGDGPRRMKVGRRTLVSRDAAAEWRRRMEAQTDNPEEGAPHRLQATRRA